ncbi:hypothetical protein HYV82_05055 [Candidatus Woesearchaeota archaeon]|nr:hypothetical protein [Candidatus Woesearchaeota archaeon]
MMRRVPLPRTFMITAMIGLMIVIVYTASGKIDLKWGVASGIVFALMFIASVLSITPPGLEKQKVVPSPSAKEVAAMDAARAGIKTAAKSAKRKASANRKKGRRRK